MQYLIVDVYYRWYEAHMKGVGIVIHPVYKNLKCNSLNICYIQEVRAPFVRHVYYGCVCFSIDYTSRPQHRSKQIPVVLQFYPPKAIFLWTGLPWIILYEFRNISYTNSRPSLPINHILAKGMPDPLARFSNICVKYPLLSHRLR